MDFQTATATAKSHLREFLEMTGRNPNKKMRCISPEHNDEHPSMSVFQRSDGVEIVKCFGCGFTGDIFDVARAYYSLPDLSTATKKVFELYGIQVDTENDWKGREKINPVKEKPPGLQTKVPAENEDFTRYYTSLKDVEANTTDYFPRRGISNEVAQKYGVKFDPAFPAGGGKRWKAVIIPTTSHSYIARNTDPNAEKGDRYRKKGRTELFNPEALDTPDQRPVIVTEGEIDALSILQAGGNALGLGGANNWRKAGDLITTRKTKKPIIIALDNDDAGQDAGKDLLKMLQTAGVQAYVLNLYGDKKDANERLTSDPENLSKLVTRLKDDQAIQEHIITTQAAVYEEQSAYTLAVKFVDQLHSKTGTPCQPTGFSLLDKKLDGGLYEGLYVIGAVSSLGKTTFTLQLAEIGRAHV